MSGREFTRAEGARLKWGFLSTVVWGAVLRTLATEASHACLVDPSVLGTRSGWIFSFFECSPQLLSGGLLGIFLFVWAWAGLALSTAFLVYLVMLAVRDARES
jgi:hypothetical protein